MKEVRVPIAKEGYPFIAFSALFSVILAILGYSVACFCLLTLTAFVLYFFRDPERVASDDNDAVISPADGKIIFVGKVADSPYELGDTLKISIFMSVFNVHVNRIPFTGRIKGIQYYPGKFFSANLDKASKKNEHNAVLLETEQGKDICFVQVAGLIARRIICHISPQDQVLRGQRFGIICFGSRLDVYLPADADVDVNVGDMVQAGTSVLGKLN